MLNVVLLPQYWGIYWALYHAAFNRIQTYLVEFCRHNLRHIPATLFPLPLTTIKSNVELRNNYNEIASFFHTYSEPVLLPKLPNKISARQWTTLTSFSRIPPQQMRCSLRSKQKRTNLQIFLGNSPSRKTTCWLLGAFVLQWYRTTCSFAPLTRHPQASISFAFRTGFHSQRRFFRLLSHVYTRSAVKTKPFDGGFLHPWQMYPP